MYTNIVERASHRIQLVLNASKQRLHDNLETARDDLNTLGLISKHAKEEKAHHTTETRNPPEEK